MRLSRILESLDKESVEIHVLTTDQSEGTVHGTKQSESINGIEIYRRKSLYKEIFSIIKHIKANNYDIIHAHNPRIASLLLLFNIKVPIVIEMHSLHDMKVFKRSLVTLVLGKSNKVIVLSEVGKKIVAQRFRLPNNKVDVLPNGIDADLFRPSGLSIEKSQIVVGYIGTMYEWQGVYDIVKAIPLVLQQDQSIKFLMVGDGPEYENLKKLAADLEIGDNIEFTGTVAAKTVPGYLNSIDIYLIPRPSNLSTETVTPLKIFEAMAAKKAIVISKVGGLLEVLEPEKDCIAISPGEYSELATAILRLSSDVDLRIRIADNAYLKASTYYNWSDIADRLLNIYYSLLR